MLEKKWRKVKEVAEEMTKTWSLGFHKKREKKFEYTANKRSPFLTLETLSLCNAAILLFEVVKEVE